MDCLFVVNNPGGFDVAFPVAELLQRRGVSIRFMLVNYGADRCESARIPHQIIDENFDLDAARQVLTKLKPSMIVAGSSVFSSYHGSTENDFRLAAREQGVFTASILDSWCSYRERFSADGKAGLDRLPDLIFSMDSRAMTDMVAVGIPQEIIEVVGSPYWDLLSTAKDSIRNLSLREIRISLSLPTEGKILMFVSEPVSEDFYCRKGQLSEFPVLEQLLEIKSQLVSLGETVNIVVRPHPREALGKFSNYGHQCLIAPDADKYRLLKASDLIVGMTSVLLAESYLLGFPTISYQPGIPSSVSWPYQIKIFKDFLGLNQFVLDFMRGKPQAYFGPNEQELIIPGATETIAKMLEERLLRIN